MGPNVFVVRVRDNLNHNRWVIALELALIVGLIAAVQFEMIRVPTLTIPFLLIGWISLRLRGLRWRDVGLRSPALGWQKTVVIALVIAAVHQLFSTFVLVPVLQRATGQLIDLSLVDQIEGNPGMLALSLVVAWLLAGLGEEMVYRGYLLNRFADVLAGQPIRWFVGYLVVSLLFGWAHQYQGIIGMIDTFVSALVWGGLYFYAGRNLWLPVLAHGFFDTIAFFFAFFGII
jgi:hypothetical protein